MNPRESRLVRSSWLVSASAAAALLAGCPRVPPGSDASTDVASPMDVGDAAGEASANEASVGDAPHDAPSAGDGGDAPDVVVTTSTVASHSSSIAISPDGAHLYVANADTDSVSIVDTATRALAHEILLAAHAPAYDPAAQRYATAVGPRAVALAPMANRLYVTGQRSGDVTEIDLATHTIVRRIPVGSEPVGVLVSPDERSVFVACSQDSTVVRIDRATGVVNGTVATAQKPWALAWSADHATLFVTQLLDLSPAGVPGASITPLDPVAMTARAAWSAPTVAPRANMLLAHGEVRGLYDAVARPGTTELWTVHLLLGTDTAQSTADPGGAGLKFNDTVFPAVSVMNADGTRQQFLSTDSDDPSNPGTDGNYGDVMSGPHAIEFTRDGHYAFVLDTNSEDVAVIDAQNTLAGHPYPVEVSVLRATSGPGRLPGHMPEGMVLSPDGARLYVDERNTSDVAVVAITYDASGVPSLLLDGDPISRLAGSDPMPANLRLGQNLFYSANSQDYSITNNNWVSCASCHIEGRSDAVVWKFTQGPRDTPSNAGGTRTTGFLFRTADRNTVRDYWHTIHVEQGGDLDPTVAYDSMLLDALTAYVNDAIPLPVPPTTDPVRVARGATLFAGAAGCASCHAGDAFTDSGSGNPTLDLAGTITLHDVGSCNTGVYPDVAHTDVDGHARAACLFDTPTLRGIADSAPYLHDGSANTLLDVLNHTRGHMGTIDGLSDDDLTSLVEYLRSL